MTEPVRLRAATADDAEAVARLLTQLGYPAMAADVPARLARMAESRGSVLVAVRRERVVGLATMHVLSVINRSRDLAQLTALVVDEDARGQGVGRVLVAGVEAEARRQGCERLTVTTHLDRSGAHAFYPQVGMAETGRRYGKDLRD